MAQHISVLGRKFIQLLVAACIGLSGAAQAGQLSVTTQQSNGVVTFDIFDSNPLDMCADGLCAADFDIDYNPADLEFLGYTEYTPYFALANAANGGPFGMQVLVSFFADEPDLVNKLLFSLHFKPLVTQQVELTVGPRDFGVPLPYQPAPVAVAIPVVAAVPEPSSVLMLAIGLAALVWRRRKHGSKHS